MSFRYLRNLLVNTLRKKLDRFIDLDVGPQVVHVVDVDLFGGFLVLLLFPSSRVFVLFGFFLLYFWFGFGLLDYRLLDNGLDFGFVSEVSELHSFSLGLVFGVVSCVNL